MNGLPTDNTISSMVITNEPKLKIHPNIANYDDTSNEPLAQSPKSSVCSLLCTNLYSIFKTHKETNENLNQNDDKLKNIDKICFDNYSSSTSCDSIDLSIFHKQLQQDQQNINKRKIMPVYFSSNSDVLNNQSFSKFSLNSMPQTNLVGRDIMFENEKNSKDMIDIAIKNLGVNLSQISTNFDSLSMEMKSSKHIISTATSSSSSVVS
jgi:hypothetical protein